MQPAEAHPKQPAGSSAPSPVGDALPHAQRRARRPHTQRRLARSRTDRRLGGVCGGIAAFVGVSSTAVRLLYLLSVLVSLGATAAGYLLLWLLLPPEETAGR